MPLTPDELRWSNDKTMTGGERSRIPELARTIEIAPAAPTLH